MEQLREGVTYMFLGIGIKNAIALFAVFIILIVMLKVITAKHPIAGVTEVIQAI